MTNEQLAELIQQGRKELVPELWEQVQKLLYLKADRFYIAYKDSCDARGFDNWDLRQASYTAFCDALRGFDVNSGYKFTTYLKYPLKNAFRRLLKIDTTGNPLNEYTSINTPRENTGGDTYTLEDIIADESTVDFVSDVERKSDAEIIRQIVDALPEPCRNVIQSYYFDGINFTGIARSMNVSNERVRQIHHNALRTLRKDKTIREMHDDYRQHQDLQTFSRFEFSPEHFELCRRLKEKYMLV